MGGVASGPTTAIADGGGNDAHELQTMTNHMQPSTSYSDADNEKEKYYHYDGHSNNFNVHAQTASKEACDDPRRELPGPHNDNTTGTTGTTMIIRESSYHSSTSALSSKSSNRRVEALEVDVPYVQHPWFQLVQWSTEGILPDTVQKWNYTEIIDDICHLVSSPDIFTEHSRQLASASQLCIEHFSLDESTIFLSWAEALLNQLPSLRQLRFRLVPQRLPEESFWEMFFFLVRHSIIDHVRLKSEADTMLSNRAAPHNGSPTLPPTSATANAAAPVKVHNHSGHLSNMDYRTAGDVGDSHPGDYYPALMRTDSTHTHTTAPMHTAVAPPMHTATGATNSAECADSDVNEKANMPGLYGVSNSVDCEGGGQLYSLNLPAQFNGPPSTEYRLTYRTTLHEG